MSPSTQPGATVSDPARLRVLASIDMENPQLRARLDEITACTAARLGMPISLVTLVLDTAQLLAGAHGVQGWVAAAGGTPVEWSFCAQMVGTGKPYIVTDASTDPVQSDNPIVVMDGIRAYAGVPVIMDGQVLGGHCVVHGQAHQFTADDMAVLRSAADDIVEVLQQYRLQPHPGTVGSGHAINGAGHDT